MHQLKEPDWYRLMRDVFIVRGAREAQRQVAEPKQSLQKTCVQKFSSHVARLALYTCNFVTSWLRDRDVYL